jgi:hypothetical protein
MSDRHWIILQQLGGAEWLRTILDKKAPLPKKYYDKLLQEKNDSSKSNAGSGHALQNQGDTAVGLHRLK